MDHQHSPGWAEMVAAMAPGPELGCALAAVDPSTLPAAALVVVIQAWERLQAHAAACQLEAMAQLMEDELYQRCDRPQDVDIAHVHRAAEPCSDEMSLALSWSPARARNRLIFALELRDELPATFDALRMGQIDSDKARLIAERTRCLSNVESRRKVEAAAISQAAQKTRTQLDNQLRRAVIAAQPADAERRRTLAAEGRGVQPPQPASIGAEDGMAFVGIYGPAEDLTALYTAVDAAARFARAQGDQRTLGQLRFDTLTGIGWSALDQGHLGCCNPQCLGIPHGHVSDQGARLVPTARGITKTTAIDLGARADTSPDRHHLDVETAAVEAAALAPREAGAPAISMGIRTSGQPLGRRHGKAAAVNVTVASSTLFGADEQPGWLDGFGPITAETARRIAQEGPWRRLLTDPASGEVLEYGRTTYAPPDRLTAFVVARDRTCRFLMCERSADSSDIDHKRPYAQGGETGASNTWALHRGHHVSKTNHGFRLHTDTRGVTSWITPAGYRYAVRPEAVGLIIGTGQRSVPAPPAERPIASTSQTSEADPPF